MSRDTSLVALAFGLAHFINLRPVCGYLLVVRLDSSVDLIATGTDIKQPLYSAKYALLLHQLLARKNRAL